MKLLPSNVGANRKNLMVLGALAVMLVGVFIYNSSDSSSVASSAPPSATHVASVNPGPIGATSAPARQITAPRPVSAAPDTRRSRATHESDFLPSLKLPEGTDVSKIDPTLHLELLAKLKNAEAAGSRSVFAFGTAPPAPTPAVDPIHPTQLAKLMGPPPPPTPTPTPAPKPEAPPPPIPLKFYGYSSKGGTKRAFFLDGDDIHVVGENDVIKNRYKIIRIGVNSVVVEDTQNKHQQTLPLIEELPG
jgi:hypothetical protein